jgi:hypothetical protein
MISDDELLGLDRPPKPTYEELEQRLAASEERKKEIINELDKRMGEIGKLERELAELRQQSLKDRKAKREEFHKAMKRAGVQGLMIAKVFAMLTGVKA